MVKKLISVWLSLTVLLFSTTITYAEDTVQGHFLNRNIDINGNRIANYYLENSLFLYQGVTYFPLTKEMGELLGFDAEMDWESRTLKILKEEPVRTKLSTKVLKNNFRNPTANVLENVKVLAMTEEKDRLGIPVVLKGVTLSADEIDIGGRLEQIKSSAEAEAIETPKLLIEELNMNGLKLLQVGDVLYLPFRALTNECCFGWDVFFDNYSGVYISTDPEVTAASYFDIKESDYNRGLASYIRHKNGSVSDGKALMLVFLFKHEAEIYGVDEILLMSMAQRESTFRTDVVASGGSVGLMQIMPATAKRYGIARSQLFDPHTNIEFGARYIGENLQRYNDNKTLALTAYNQGPGAVSRGGYNTRYAGRINSAEDSLKGYLVQNGYGLGNENK
ncbi:MAG: lytic transglycosylase domain-containing protein [Anaerovoracaceae bacterium]|jgi:hypothetical protein